MAFCLKNDLDTAIADCDVAIRLNEDDADAYFFRGWALDEKKQYDRAITDYTRAIQLGTRISRAYNNRGVVYSRKKEKQQALADYERAVEIDSKNYTAWSNAADMLHDAREYQKAMEYATRSINLNPFRSIAWKIRGWALRDGGNLEAAVQNFNDAIEFDSKEPDFYLNRGIAYSRINGQLAKAVQDYSTSIRIGKNYAIGYLYRGEAFEKANQFSDAQKDYEVALRMNPDYKDRIKRRNTCLFRVANNTAEPLRVYLQYEYLSDKGEWVWWPNQNWVSYNFASGETANLVHDGWKIRRQGPRLGGGPADRQHLQHLPQHRPVAAPLGGRPGPDRPDLHLQIREQVRPLGMKNRSIRCWLCDTAKRIQQRLAVSRNPTDCGTACSRLD